MVELPVDFRPEQFCDWWRLSAISSDLISNILSLVDAAKRLLANSVGKLSWVIRVKKCEAQSPENCWVCSDIRIIVKKKIAAYPDVEIVSKLNKKPLFVVVVVFQRMLKACTFIVTTISIMRYIVCWLHTCNRNNRKVSRIKKNGKYFLRCLCQIKFDKIPLRGQKKITEVFDQFWLAETKSFQMQILYLVKLNVDLSQFSNEV